MLFNTLSELKLGDRAKVISINVQSPAARQKLFACGLVPGVEFTVERIAPLGDPMQLRLEGDILLSIRKSEASDLHVECLCNGMQT